MSEQLAIISLVVAFIVLFVGIALAISANRDRKTFEEARLRLGDGDKAPEPAPKQVSAARAEPAKAAKSVDLGPITKERDELAKTLKSTKQKLDKSRQKAADATAERDDLRAKVNDLSSQVKQASSGQAGLVDLRLELADALGQVEQLKAQLAKNSSAADAPVEPAPPRSEPAPGRSEQPARDDSGLRDKIKAREQELRELKSTQGKKLKKALREVEHQKRRAQNNDKAFRVTQRELDAARSRLRMLTEKLAALEPPQGEGLGQELSQGTSPQPLIQAVEVSQELAQVGPPENTIKMEAPLMRNEDDHVTVEFDPAMVEDVVREVEQEQSQEADAPAQAPPEPTPAEEGAQAEVPVEQVKEVTPSEEEAPQEQEASEAEHDVVRPDATADAVPDADVPEEDPEPAPAEPIVTSADTTYEDIPLADDAMSIDDAWSEFMPED